ncbi:MAG: hypothetical protein NWE92_09085 [Candidatus Bathyarchaeota archaeon]|nr:hypothetical protein [Candidatus Bathyarchaeota archaeon]
MPENENSLSIRKVVPSSDQEEIDILVNLGCSFSQSRVYLALIQNGSSTIGSIAKVTGIHRENLYKIIHSLIQKGLVEQEVDSPSKYYALPPDEVLTMLINRRQTQISQLKIQSEAVVEKLRKKRLQNAVGENENAHFIVVSGKDIVIERLKKVLDKTQISVDTVTTQLRFSQAIIEFAEGYRQALKRGVKIRLATEKYVPEKEALEILKELTKNPDFQVKCFPNPLQAIAAIFDKKEAHVSISVTANLSGAAGLWSNNSCFTAIAQAYFEEKWRNSTNLL